MYEMCAVGIKKKNIVAVYNLSIKVNSLKKVKLHNVCILCYDIVMELKTFVL